MESAFNSSRIALTGSIACGKSLFAKFLRELGVQTLDADDIVHELIPVEERRRLAPIVFADPVARKALEARIHPLVRDKIERWFHGEDNSRYSRSSRCPRSSSVSSPSSSSSPSSQSLLNRCPSKSQSDLPGDFPVIRVAIIPLLFECNWDADYDIIICISSPAEEQIRRMVETRGLTREAAEARLNAQLPVSEKAARSHYVVVNDSTVEHLREEAVRCVEWLRSRQS